MRSYTGGEWLRYADDMTLEILPVGPGLKADVSSRGQGWRKRVT
jgi:hypothetical protein